MVEGTTLGDKALAVFAFAAYHQLESGQPVSKIVRDDGNGHKADDDAVQDLANRGLARAEGPHIVFSDSGLAVLRAAVDALRGATQAG